MTKNQALKRYGGIIRINIQARDHKFPYSRRMPFLPLRIGHASRFPFWIGAKQFPPPVDWPRTLPRQKQFVFMRFICCGMRSVEAAPASCAFCPAFSPSRRSIVSVCASGSAAVLPAASDFGQHIMGERAQHGNRCRNKQRQPEPALLRTYSECRSQACARSLPECIGHGPGDKRNDGGPGVPENRQGRI